VFDVGCANGFLVDPFLRAGNNVRGIELSPYVRQVLTPELNLRVDVGDFSAAEGVWDLVCCIEVAEHLPPDRSRDLVLKLTKLARKHIFFTAAPPGQSGHGHVNCRPMEDWLAWFKQQGWQANGEKTDAVRACLDDIHVARWLIGNSLVLEPMSSC
jgi:SAM-dependent methyltransferase